MKKFLSVLLVLAMIIAVLPAAMADEGLEPITVTVFRGDPGDQPTDDNKIYKMIEEEFGIKFEIEYLAGDLDETLGLKLNDEKYPDLFDGGNSAETLENAGALIDLLPYITEEGTPNLYKHIYTYDRVKQLLDEDGHLHIIPNYGINYNSVINNAPNGPMFFLQKKVVAWNNYVVPTTLNEYFDLIERYIAENPTNPDGVAYKGFAILCEGWRHFCLINPVQHLMGRPNDGEVIIDVTTPEFTTTTFINQEYAKPYYAKLNEMYNKGLISKDTFVMTYDQYIADLSSGVVLGMFDQGWDFGVATDALNAAKKYDETFVGIPLVYDESYGYGKIEEHYVNGNDLANTVMNKDRGFGISVTCEYPERLVNLLENLLSDKWQKLLQWGVEGEDYTVENGRMVMTTEQFENTKDANWKRANRAMAIWESAPKKQGVMDDGNAWAPGDQAEIYFGTMSDYDKEFLAACGKTVPADFFDLTLELAPYGEAWQIDKTPIEIDYEDFNNIQDKMLPEIIMADPAELDAKWDAFVEAINPSCEVYTNYMQAEVLKLVEQAQAK